MAPDSSAGVRSVSAVEVNEERIERLPRPLRERAWKLADGATSVERRHNEALRLIHDALMHLASLAFADYRRLRFNNPSEDVEKVLLKFDRPWLRDHLELLTCSLRAVPADQAVLRTRNLKLEHGDRLRRAMDALEQAVACDARRIGASLEAALHQQPPRKMPVLEFLGLVIDYRNGALGHQERTNWTDLDDFYECMTPVLDEVATEFVCHDVIHDALTCRPLATLTQIELNSDNRFVHRCQVDQQGRDDQRRTIVADRPITQVWCDSRWKAEIGSRLLLDIDGDDELRILSPFHNFAATMPPPAPLVLPEALGRQTAVVREVLQQTWAYSRGQRSERAVDASAIAGKLGLESGDLAAILASLGAVLEGPPTTGEPAPGKSASDSAALRQGLGHVLAVELGHEEFGLTISDLDGRSVSSTYRDRKRYQELLAEPLDVMRFAAGQADRVRLEAGIDPQSIFAVVVSVAACVTSDDPANPAAPHRISPGSGFPKSWDNFSPALEMNRALHLMVDWDPKAAVGNDANLAALAESTWGAGRGSRALIYVEWSEGIGGGLVFDGELFAGAHGGAAEFGHYRGEVSAPYPCSSGHLNCLEAVAATSSMLRQAQDQSGDDGPQDFSAFWQLVRDGKHRYAHIAAVAASRVGITLASIVAALDPDRIVIGGPFGGDDIDAEIISGPLLGGIEERLPPGYRPPELCMSELGEDAVLQGAVTHGLQIFGAEYLVATAKRGLVDGPGALANG